MISRNGRVRRTLSLVMTILLVVTGAPWTETHAHAAEGGSHGHGIASDLAGSPLAQSGQGDDDDLHVHDLGLFSQLAAAFGISPQPSSAGAAAGEFPDPTVFLPHGNQTPPLRPPARP